MHWIDSKIISLKLKTNRLASAKRKCWCRCRHCWRTLPPQLLRLMEKFTYWEVRSIAWKILRQKYKRKQKTQRSLRFFLPFGKDWNCQICPILTFSYKMCDTLCPYSWAMLLYLTVTERASDQMLSTTKENVQIGRRVKRRQQLPSIREACVVSENTASQGNPYLALFLQINAWCLEIRTLKVCAESVFPTQELFHFFHLSLEFSIFFFQSLLFCFKYFPLVPLRDIFSLQSL